MIIDHPMKDRWVGDADLGFYHLGRQLVEAPQVDTGHWQALKGVPQTQTRELRMTTIHLTVPETREELASFTDPSDPWAEHQFLERVAGEPVNPGETYTKWPWFKGNVPEHQDQAEQFSHTYMERYWPLWGGDLGPPPHNPKEAIKKELDHIEGPRQGIRYRYGDLADVVRLLALEPMTRQAYLPVWFPEDTGATSGQRVPCSLGYHFMLRDGRLHCLYTIRSCDFLRHFRDDVYMTARLVQWVLDQLNGNQGVAGISELGSIPKVNFWQDIKPGTLSMVIHSLHIFEGDMPKMRREYGYVDATG